MNKQEFLDALGKSLSGLPAEEREERLTFYGEMIDDRIEEGLSEEEAVRDIGTVEALTAQIVADVPFAKLVKERIKPKRSMKVWEIVLLVLGSPIWLSVLIAMLAVILSVYVCLWSVVIALWGVFAAMVLSAAACGLTGISLFVFSLVEAFGSVNVVGLIWLVVFGAGLVLAGLAVFVYVGCIAATKGLGVLTKKIVISVKNKMVKKEKTK